MMMILFTLLLMFTFNMYLLNHPLSMGLMILIQTLLICLISGLMINTYWFSYILFLTFSGGLLVLFIYVSVIASNEMFKSLMPLKNFFLIISILMLIMLIFYYKMNWLNFSFIKEMMLNQNQLFFNNLNKMNLIKLYNKQTFLMLMMLTTYLLITLIATIKIINIKFGPLRKNF